MFIPLWVIVLISVGLSYAFNVTYEQGVEQGRKDRKRDVEMCPACDCPVTRHSPDCFLIGG